MHGNPVRPRPQHVAWSGLVLSCDDPFWDTHFPPNGWRCTCGVEAVSREELAASGRPGPDATPEIKTRPVAQSEDRADRPGAPRASTPASTTTPARRGNRGKARRRARWGGPFGQPPSPLPGTPPASPVAAPTPAERPQRAAVARVPRPRLDYPQWVDDQTLHMQPDGTARVTGRLPAAVETEGGAPRSIVISSERMIHLVRDAKHLQGKTIPLADLVDLPAHLARPQAVLRQKNTGNILFVWNSANAPAGMLVKVVVALHGYLKLAGAKHSANVVRSAGLVDAATLRGSDYELLDGAI